MKPDVTTFLADWANAERTRDTTFLDDSLTDDFVAVGPLGFTPAAPKSPTGVDRAKCHL